MNRLSKDKRACIISALIEGNSLRAKARMCGANVNTVMWLLEDIGTACADYQRKALSNLRRKRAQCDEIWPFCYAKNKNVPEKFRGRLGYGDVRTWVAMDAETKLVICWRVGTRSAWDAQHFRYDVVSRLKSRVQLTTDGHRAYLDAVELAFGNNIDHAMLVKLYGGPRRESEARYSPAECIGCRRVAIKGAPKREHISTSFVERQNLTMRMQMRRFTRLTNAFSKKLANHEAAIALHYTYYNFCRIHRTLRVTPAMEAGVTDHVWDIRDILGLIPN